jgi:hypothetical protein
MGSARDRMIFWIVFTVVMFGVLIWKLVAMGQPRCRACGTPLASFDTTCPKCQAPTGRG